MSKCRTPVHLFLQGIISEQNKIRLNELTSNLKISDKVSLVSPASPDKIVESLLIYDVGLAGEIAAEDNQRLTSSNKLFEYIYAGLAVVVPDLPGLAETVLEFKVGKLYEQGNFLQLAELIDNLNMNRVLLRELKEASIIAANNELYWEHDFDEVWKYIN